MDRAITLSTSGPGWDPAVKGSIFRAACREPGVPRQGSRMRGGGGSPATPPPAYDPKEAEARPAPGVLKQHGSGNRNFSDGGCG